MPGCRLDEQKPCHYATQPAKQPKWVVLVWVVFWDVIGNRMKGIIIEVYKRTPVTTVTAKIFSSDRPKQGVAIGELISFMHRTREARSCPLRHRESPTRVGASCKPSISLSNYWSVAKVPRWSREVTYGRFRRASPHLGGLFRGFSQFRAEWQGGGRKFVPRSGIGNGGEESDEIAGRFAIQTVHRVPRRPHGDSQGSPDTITRRWDHEKGRTIRVRRVGRSTAKQETRKTHVYSSLSGPPAPTLSRL